MALSLMFASLDYVYLYFQAYCYTFSGLPFVPMDLITEVSDVVYLKKEI